MTITFDGRPSAWLETALGERFESWVPSRRQLLVKDGDHVRVVQPGDVIEVDDGE